MSFGQQLLGGLFDATFTPGLNPDVTHVGPNGEYLNTQGQQVPLYKPGNLVQRILSPTARQYSAYNAQASAYPDLEQSQRLAQEASAKAIAQQHWNMLSPEEQTAMGGTFNNAYTLNNGNFTAPNLANTSTTLEDLKNNNFAQQAKARFNTAGAIGAEQGNAWTKAALDKMYGTPGATANADYWAQSNRGAMGAGESTLIPSRLIGEGMNIGNQNYSLAREREQLPTMYDNKAIQLQGENAALPNQMRSLIANSDTGAQLSERENILAPYKLLGMNAEAAGNLYQQEHPAIYDIPGQGRIDPMTGMVYPGRYMSPEMRASAGLLGTSLDSLMGSPGGHSMPTGAVTKNGKPLPLPPSSVYNSQPTGVDPLLGNAHPLIGGQETYNGVVHTPIPGTIYFHDEHGNVYGPNHQFVPEENYKGTPLEAVVKQQQKVNDNVLKAYEEHAKFHGKNSLLIGHLPPPPPEPAKNPNDYLTEQQLQSLLGHH